MNPVIEERVRERLLSAACNKRTVSYQAVHAAFLKSSTFEARYALIERVAAFIHPPQVADYACLMALASGLPGPAFYVRPRWVHLDRYYAPRCADKSRSLWLVEKKQFTDDARQDGYRYYRKTFPSRDVEPASRDANLQHCASRATAIVAVVLSLCCAAQDAHAQEFSFLGGGSRAASDNTYVWAFEYQEGLGEYLTASFMWLNEGHVPNHHRDGQVIQLWARLPLAQRRFVLSAGVGPYRYFDTTVADAGGSYSNDHGWGVVYSLRAAYYASSRWIAQLLLNRVHVQRGPDASALMVGIGYQLDAPNGAGPRQWAASRTSKVTGNEVTAYIGKTILNSDQSQGAIGGALDYRVGLLKYFDLTVGYLHEGNTSKARRDGLTSQLWATRAFFDDTVTLGVGAGAYYALSEYQDSESSGPGRHQFSGLISISGAYRFTQHWAARLTWNRVVTRYDRDTDVILAGIGYRW